VQWKVRAKKEPSIASAITTIHHRKGLPGRTHRHRCRVCVPRYAPPSLSFSLTRRSCPRGLETSVRGGHHGRCLSGVWQLMTHGALASFSLRHCPTRLLSIGLGLQSRCGNADLDTDGSGLALLKEVPGSCRCSQTDNAY
jgi:hypothetical protein